MIGALYQVLAAMSAHLFARVVVGAGLTLIVGGSLTLLVQPRLEAAAASIGGIGGDLGQLILLGGLGEALTILGSAILTRLAIQVANRVLGIKVNAPSS